MASKRKKVKDLKTIPTVICTEDESASADTFDILKFIVTHIDPSPHNWDDIDVWVETYPTIDPYLEVDRTIMRIDRPSGGSATVHALRPDSKMAHCGIAHFYDLDEKHHNPEVWYTDFEGRTKGKFSKKIPGHRAFDITENIKIKINWGQEEIEMRIKAFSKPIKRKRVPP